MDICQNEQQAACQNGGTPMPQVIEIIGAGEGNRTLVISLEDKCCRTSMPFFSTAKNFAFAAT
jgi:hypothetical protein